MKNPIRLVSALAISPWISHHPPPTGNQVEVQHEIYGKMPDGQDVKIFILTNKSGLRAKMTEYGAMANDQRRGLLPTRLLGRWLGGKWQPGLPDEAGLIHPFSFLG